MARVVYVNGRYAPYHEAVVHAEDRGFQFGDGVYEVCEIRSGAIIDETRHLDRLERSLRELRIAEPMSRLALSRVIHETIRRNRVADGIVYLQVTRGAGPRTFLVPAADTRPTVVCLARPQSRAAAEAKARTGISVKTMPDTRWARCDIKTVMLLPSALAKEAAREEGAQEAWFVDEHGFITEGASSNAWIVRGDRILTRACDSEILRGVTRTTTFDVIRAQGWEVVEQRQIEPGQGGGFSAGAYRPGVDELWLLSDSPSGSISRRP